MFLKKRTYLDVAASAPVHKAATRAFVQAMRAQGNPSSPHTEGREAKDILENARRDIARLTEVKPDDIVFTGGATEANALIILGLPEPGTHVLYLPSAHASTVENMRLLAIRGVVVELIPIKEGRVDMDALRKLLRPTTVLVSMDAVCGETGTIWNTREVANALHTHAPRAVLHVDASQAPLSEKVSRAHFAADALVFDASKAGGMRGIGCLIAHRTISLKPLYQGGGQERGLRSGTESPALAAAFAAALTVCVKEREVFCERSLGIRDELVPFITNSIKNVYVNKGREVAAHILSLSLPGRDTDYLVALLDEAGFAVSTRSACETDSTEGSRAVFALYGDRERAKTSLRISWNQDSSAHDLRKFGKALTKAVAFVDRLDQVHAK